MVRKGEKHDSVTIFTYPLTGLNWWSGRGKGKRIKGTVSQYSNFHYILTSTGGQAGGKARGLKGQYHDIHISILTGFNWWSGRGKRHADKRDSVTNSHIH